MLQFQLQQAPLRFGLAEGVDPHQTPFGTLMTAENACWTRTGCLGKRQGTDTLTTNIVGGGAISAAKRLVTRGSELAVIDGTSIYSYTAAGWVNRGRVPELGIEWTVATDTVTGIATCDSVPLPDGQLLETWVTGDPSATVIGSLYYQIRELTTGAVVTGPTLVSTTAAPLIRIVVSGSTWVLLWSDGTGDLKTTTSTVTATLKTGATASRLVALDACVIGNEFVVAFTLAAGGIRLVRASFAATPVEQTTATVTGVTSALVLSVGITGAASETLYISWFDQTNQLIGFAAANPSTLAQTVAPSSVIAETGLTSGCVTLARTSSTTCLLVFGMWSDSREAGTTRTVSITNAGVKTVGQNTIFMRPLSRPFEMGGRWYCVLATDGESVSGLPYVVTTSDTFLADVTPGGVATEPFRQVGKIDTLIGGSWSRGWVTTASAVSSDWTTISLGYQSMISSDVRGVQQAVRTLRVTRGSELPADMWRNVELGGEAAIAAGVPASYDGTEAIGYGFPHGPYVDWANLDFFASGGSMASGDYLYSVVAERRSGANVLHRSPVGLSVSAENVTGPDGRVEVPIVSVRLGHATRMPAHFPIYRSVVDGSIAQRIAVVPSYMTVVDEGLSDVTSVVIDTNNDNGIGDGTLILSARPALYTSGGELEDCQPPSSLTLALHQSRLWSLSGDHTTLWFSKDASSNPGVAPGFHPTTILTFDKPVVALAPLDDKLIVYSESSFWMVLGQGPTPNGQNASYEIASVQTDVGCINPRSLVSMPDGHMFQSARGIYLLTRDMGLAWIGRPVKDKLAAYPRITSAVLVATRNEIRFTTSNTGGTESIVLVYNYVEKQWTTSRYAVGGVAGAPIADACMFGGVWTFVTTSGVVVRESTTTFLDGSTWVPLTIETAWNNAAGPLAFQSVRRFAVEGVSNSNHDLTILVGFDNDPSYAQTRTFAAGTPVTSIGPLEECTISIGTRRKCRAIRFKIQDATPTSPGTYPVGTGEGPSFDMIGVEVGIKKGFATKSAQHMG